MGGQVKAVSRLENGGLRLFRKILLGLPALRRRFPFQPSIWGFLGLKAKRTKASCSISLFGVAQMFFKQVQQHGDNFSYMLADEDVGEAAVVDSSFNDSEIIKILKAKQFNLKYVINTHGHSDHTAGNAELTSMFHAKVVAYKLSKVDFDLGVEDGDVLFVGKIPIKVIYTPGHTVDSICLLVENRKLLTGDTLFVGECGRTDFAGGSSKSMYDSLFNKLLKLDDNVEVYPGHDYGSSVSSTIGEERISNYTLQPRSLKDFIEFMAEP